MSKEFEEIVLKKLDNIEAETKQLNSRVGNLEEETKKLNNRVGNLEDETKKLNNRVANLEVETRKLSSRVANLEVESKETKEVVQHLRENFTIFDFEINKKIDTLFDSDSVNKNNLVSLNAKTFNHDTRISNLEDRERELIKV